jgi:hypothetical protein
MSLIPTPPPAAAQAAFTAGLPGFLSGAAGLGVPAFVGLAPTIPSHAEIGTGFVAAIQLFVLRLSDAATSTETISPASAGWQFFAGNLPVPTPQMVLGTVVRRPPTQAWKLINVYYGQTVPAQLIALNALAGLTDVKREDYEARMLSIPGVNLRGYWLVAQTEGSPDLVVPIPAGATLIPTLDGPGPFRMPNFLARIGPLAASNLTMAAGRGA